MNKKRHGAITKTEIVPFNIETAQEKISRYPIGHVDRVKYEKIIEREKRK